MLILEGKVRTGLRPLVTVDDRASVDDVAAATIALLHEIYNQLEKRNDHSGIFYLLRLGHALQSIDDW